MLKQYVVYTSMYPNEYTSINIKIYLLFCMANKWLIMDNKIIMISNIVVKLKIPVLNLTVSFWNVFSYTFLFKY